MNRSDPACPPLRTVAAVLENRDEGGDNRRLVLDVDGWQGFWPGQFAMLGAVAPGDVPRSDPLLPRPMAIFREQSRDGVRAVEVLYRVVGRGTALMAELAPGDRAAFVGPLGQGFALSDAAPHNVLVGGGSGIASLYALAAELSAGASDASATTVILGARSEVDLLGAADFADLPVDLQLVTEDGSRGSTGRVTDLLDPVLAAGRETVVYACGPTPMMRACAEMSAERDVRCVVSLENNMACGFGACLGCAVPLDAGGFGLVCREGPVFEASEVAWGGLP